MTLLKTWTIKLERESFRSPCKKTDSFYSEPLSYYFFLPFSLKPTAHWLIYLSKGARVFSWNRNITFVGEFFVKREEGGQTC